MTCEMETEFEEGGGEAEHSSALFLFFSVLKVRRFGVGTGTKQSAKKTNTETDATKTHIQNYDTGCISKY